jgi:hypothetical protein
VEDIGWMLGWKEEWKEKWKVEEEGGRYGVGGRPSVGYQ